MVLVRMADDDRFDCLVPVRVLGEDLIEIVNQMAAVDVPARFFARRFTACVDQDGTVLELYQSRSSLADVDVMDRYLAVQRRDARAGAKQY